MKRSPRAGGGVLRTAGIPIRGIGLLCLLAAFLPAPPALAAQGDLRASAASVEGALSSGRLAPLSAHLSSEGVLLYLRGEAYPGLRADQALAALQEFFGDFEAGRLSRVRIEASEGGVGRGFVEFGWATTVHGTSESLRYRIYVGFLWMDQAWRIDEFRVLPATSRSGR